MKQPQRKPNLPNPEPIAVRDVEWVVLTPETVPKGNYIFFALSPEDYKDLALIQADTLRWVKEALWRLNYYREADKDTETPEDEPSGE